MRLKSVALLSMAVIEAFAANTSRKVVISLADHTLALIEDGRAVRVYPVAIGKPDSPSPTGTFEIVSRVAEPTWYGPHKVVAPGPGNPLGTRWMGLSYKGYGIHGTNAPRSIGKSASHGCIRMRRKDVEELFELVKVGDAVEFIPDATGEAANVFDPPQLRGITPPFAVRLSPSVLGSPRSLRNGL